jgi:ATP-grasp domain, R2K clade family 3
LQAPEFSAKVATETHEGIIGMTMLLLFCDDPLNPRESDADYAAEFDAARRCGFPCGLLSFESLTRGEAEFARWAGRPREGERVAGWYRGWMLRGEQYARLFAAMGERGIDLVVTPDAYAQAHYLPEALPLIAEESPATVWMEGTDLEQAWEISRPLAVGAMVVKDFVKSAKHKWDEACFIPSEAMREKFESVVSAFVRIRGESLNRGLVFREFVNLMPVGTDVISGRTVFEEYRLFFWRGKLLRAATYDAQGGVWQEFARWEEYARRFESPFVTIDVARRTDGRWMIVETGDAGVSGLPATVDTFGFYAVLWNALADGAA